MFPREACINEEPLCEQAPPTFHLRLCRKKGMTSAMLWDQIVGGVFKVKEVCLEQGSLFVSVVGGGGDSYGAKQVWSLSA